MCFYMLSRRLKSKNSFTVKKKTRARCTRVLEKVRFQLSEKPINLKWSRRFREIVLFTLNCWSMSCERPTIVNHRRQFRRERPWYQWNAHIHTNSCTTGVSVCVCVCVCLGFYTLVDNCRSPMRDTLLKAEKRTKNRCITRTEFPNLVIQRVCYDSIY